MRREEILQLKVLALQSAAGDQGIAQSIYDWLRERTDDNGTPLVPDVEPEPEPGA